MPGIGSDLKHCRAGVYLFLLYIVPAYVSYPSSAHAARHLFNTSISTLVPTLGLTWETSG